MAAEVHAWRPDRRVEGSEMTGKDPIQNRLLSDECWDGHHDAQCIGYPQNGCKCGCHESVPRARVKKDPKSERTLMDVYGTVQIGKEISKWEDE
jgi:hypothetical protein